MRQETFLLSCGTVVLWFTGLNQVEIRYYQQLKFETIYYTLTMGKTSFMPDVVLNFIDGKWSITYNRSSKVGEFSVHCNLPPTIKEKFEKEILTKIVPFISTKKQWLLDATKEQIQYQISRLESDVNDLQKQLNLKKEELTKTIDFLDDCVLVEDLEKDYTKLLELMAKLK